MLDADEQAPIGVLLWAERKALLGQGALAPIAEEEDAPEDSSMHDAVEADEEADQTGMCEDEDLDAID